MQEENFSMLYLFTLKFIKYNVIHQMMLPYFLFTIFSIFLVKAKLVEMILSKLFYMNYLFVSPQMRPFLRAIRDCITGKKSSIYIL